MEVSLGFLDVLLQFAPGAGRARIGVVSGLLETFKFPHRPGKASASVVCKGEVHRSITEPQCREFPNKALLVRREVSTGLFSAHLGKQAPSSVMTPLKRVIYSVPLVGPSATMVTR
jgi:hypothetical protein